MIMKSRDLNLIFTSYFPELKTEYNDEVCWQEGDDTGSHVVFGDVLAPYIERVVKNKEEEKIKKVFVFIEQLLDLRDEYVDEVIAFSIIEKLFGDRENILFSRTFMGNRTLVLYEEIKNNM